MAMEWLKGLVAPVAQFSPSGQPVQGAPPGSAAFPPAYGGPPPGAYPAPPPGAYGASTPGWDPAAAPAAPPVGAAPPYGTGTPSPSYGAGMPGVDPAASYGSGMPGVGPNAWGASPQGPDARVAQLENRCEELRRDLESVALFAQTLLAILEDKKVLSQQDFQEMRRKLDLMDGRLDDRIAKSNG